MGRLEGKTAVVTGGADGIGHAIADAMTREGAHVFVGDIDDAKGGAFVADLDQSRAARPTIFHCDVALEKIAGADFGRRREDRPARYPRQ
jgi:NAD(P)-dependent dehydrogenase (short-subunit alcohol dehydrogenase family)